MLPALATTKINDIRLRDPVRMPADTPLLDAVTMLRERKRGAVVVEDEQGKLLGIFTEHDLVTRVDHGNQDWHEWTVGDCMTDEPIRLQGAQPVALAIRAMQRGGFRNLPIVDGDGRVTGIVTIRDILRHVVDRYPQELLNLPPDPDHEANSPWGG